MNAANLKLYSRNDLHFPPQFHWFNFNGCCVAVVNMVVEFCA